MIRIFLAAVALAVLPPNSRAEEAAVRLSVQAAGGPKTRPPLSAVAGSARAESRQPRAMVVALVSRAAEFLLRQAGRQRAGTLPVAAARQVAGGQVRIKVGMREPGRLGGGLDTPDWEVLQRR